MINKRTHKTKVYLKKIIRENWCNQWQKNNKPKAYKTSMPNFTA
jgi:hypothetical protein